MAEAVPRRASTTARARQPRSSWILSSGVDQLRHHRVPEVVEPTVDVRGAYVGGVRVAPLAIGDVVVGALAAAVEAADVPATAIELGEPWASAGAAVHGARQIQLPAAPDVAPVAVPGRVAGVQPASL